MVYDFIVVGAGLTGISCARSLTAEGLNGIVLDSADRIGGRVKTEIIDGYRLDHGFQVLQTGYPEAARVLDYKRLNLKKFPSGVAVRNGGRFNIIADPRYHLRHIFSTAASPIGSLKDRILMLKLARSVSAVSFEGLFAEEEVGARQYLESFGFSEKFIESFFVPFFAGACLERSISASSRVLRYIFRVFAEGDAAVPANGMGEIPRLLAADLKEQTIVGGSRVTKIEGNTVFVEGGRQLSCKRIILALPAPAIADLVPEAGASKSVGEMCLYFTADWRPPFDRPFLVLNGERDGPVNNLAFPSLVAPSYAPAGKTLIAAVVLGDKYMGKPNLIDDVRSQCADWFGVEASSWEHLRTFSINHALPDQSPPTTNPYKSPRPFAENLWIAGEYSSLPGIQWALLSGRKTAEAVLEEMKKQ